MNRIELCDMSSCTQCRACENICPKHCISMEAGAGGFSIPKIDRNVCVECGACMNSCHKINPEFEYRLPQKTLACWTRRKHDRRNSSSGGAFSVLARKIIRDGGVVFGATMTPELTVKHIGIEKEEDIIRLQGSKYVQSDMGAVHKEVKGMLASGRKVLFTGTPCQVASLYSYLNGIPENLYTGDIVCHGVPSQKSFDTYIDRIGLKGKCRNFSFRFTEGWGFSLSRQTTAPTDSRASKKTVISPSKSYYLKAFTKGLMFDEACYTCPYARSGRISDFTMADYWGIGASLPFNYPTTGGISCLLVNTPKGEAILAECADLEYEERPLEEAVKGNYNLSHVSSRPSGRDTYYNDSLTMPISMLCKKYGIGASMRDYLRILKQVIVRTLS